jgi:hypothetical protein
MSEPAPKAGQPPDQPGTAGQAAGASGAAGPPSPDAANSTLDKDVACVACGYNLRGLRPDGRCPECGRAVADSLKSEHWSQADPKYVRRLLLGLAILALAFAAGLIGEIFESALYAGLVIYDSTSAVGDFVLRSLLSIESDARLTEIVSYFIPNIGLLIGIVLLTRHDPERPLFMPQWRKWPAIALGMSMVVHASRDCLHRPGAIAPSWTLPEAILATIAVFGALVCLERIARRSKQMNVRWIWLCRWLVVAIGMFSVLLEFFEGLIVVSVRWGRAFLWLSLCLSLIPPFVGVTMSVVLYRMRRAMKEAVGEPLRQDSH